MEQEVREMHRPQSERPIDFPLMLEIRPVLAVKGHGSSHLPGAMKDLHLPEIMQLTDSPALNPLASRLSDCISEQNIPRACFSDPPAPD